MEELALIYDEFNSANKKSIAFLESELVKIKAGKASPSMLSGVMVDYYGSMTPIQQVANIGTLDARTITIQPWEKNLVGEIMKSIINANLGFAPQNNADAIIINIPILTEERRKELAKNAKSEGESAKVAIRNNRKDALDMVKSLKDEGMSEDMMKDAEEKVQVITNAAVKQIDDIVTAKEKEIMTI